jgi:hypothetical protein
MRRRALRLRNRRGSSLSAENRRARFHSLICSTLPTPLVLAARNVLAASADTERFCNLLLDALAVFEVEVAPIDTT